MHRRDAAEHGRGEVERRGGGPRFRGRGQHRHGFRPDIGDQPQPVAAVERPGLLRDVGGRVAQAAVGLQARGGGLAHHLAAAVLPEPVDHDAVEAEHGAELPGRALVHVLQAARGHQPRHHALDGCDGVEARFGGGWLGLHHRERRLVARRLVHRDVVGRPPGDEGKAEQPFRLLLAVQHLQRAGDLVHRLALQQGG